jgi:hypothetical protein
MPSPQNTFGGQVPQSLGQVSVLSPHSGWQNPLPQMHPPRQSSAHVLAVSPQLGSQVPSPQNEPGGHAQSPQLSGNSLHSDSQMPLPHSQKSTHSPEAGWQTWPLTVQSLHVSPPSPQTLSIVPTWQRPL